VQGKLRNEYINVIIESECVHCSRSLTFEVDSDLKLKVRDHGCDPVIFVPDVDLFKLQDESIIDSF
jgi:hypothetical protein